MAIMPYNYLDVKGLVVERLKTILADAGYTEKAEIRVLKSDPHDPADIPCVGVNLANADEDGNTLSDESGAEFDPTLFNGAGGYKHFRGAFFRETLEIRLWHKNADERDKIRVLLMAQLFGLKKELTSLGLRTIKISGGRDEQDNAQLQPHPIYFAPFTLNYLNPVEVWEEYEVIGDITVNATYNDGGA